MYHCGMYLQRSDGPTASHVEFKLDGPASRSRAAAWGSSGPTWTWAVTVVFEQSRRRSGCSSSSITGNAPA